MAQRLHWAAAAILFLPVIAAPNSGIIQVTGLRSWSHPGDTRVIVETSGPAEYHADRATNPDRLFFDVLHARPLIDGRRIATRQINDALVRRIRIAETSPGTTRVVFDLAGAVDFKVSRLTTPDRLVIELTALTRTPTAPKPPAVTTTFGPVVVPPAGPTFSAPSVKATLTQIPAPAVAPPPPPVSEPAPAPVHAAAPPRTAPSATSATAKSRPHRAYVPPVLASAAPPLIPMPAQPPAIDLIALNPWQVPDAWTSLAHVKMPRKPAAASASASSSAPAPFVNTTTRVLPAIRPSTMKATPKASTEASLSLTRALGLKIKCIVIDAGHGGHDDGTSGPNGVLEKDVVLDVALRLARLVQNGLGAEVVLTRSDDTFVPLTERTAIANEHKADLFLSIHANSSPTPAVAGTETFLLNLNSSPGAISVAARENAGADKSVGELRDLVQSIALNDKIAESQSFAADIQSSIFTQAAKGNAAAHDRGVKKAPFVVLIGARMPSVLAEIGFLTNPKDESNLSKPEYRQKVAESLYHGIEHYALSLSHFEIAGAAPAGHSTTAANK